MHPIRNSRIGAFALALPLLLTVRSATAQVPLGGTERDEWQRVPAVLDALGAEHGSRIADIGAGGGYFTDRLSLAVGAEGRVYAVDIAERALARLEEWREVRRRNNVELILGEADDPRLPYRSLDGALIVNAYHEMTEYPAMLAGISRALRSGGRLVIVDNTPPDSVTTRAEQVERHNIAMALVAADLEEAGFDVVDRQPRFIVLEHDDHSHLHWLLVAERPRLAVPSPASLDIDPETNSGASDFWCAFPGTREELRARDVGRASVPVERLDEHVEILTFQLIPRGSGSGELVLEWERTRVRIPIDASRGDNGCTDSAGSPRNSTAQFRPAKAGIANCSGLWP